MIALVGCSSGGGGDEQSCLTSQVAYGYDTDQYGNTGLHLLPTGNSHTFISFEEMEAEYIDIEVCLADNNTPGPNVEFFSFNQRGLRIELAAYLYAAQLVIIDVDSEDWLPTRNCISDREFLRHEFTHHILFLNGQDPEHANPAFARCDALGPKSCNGEYCE